MQRNSSDLPTPKNIRFDAGAEKLIYFKMILNRLGVKKKYTGYYCLLDVLNIIINEKRAVKNFQREVYPSVSAKMQVSQCTIERNIRNLIDKCWSYSMMERLGVYYPEGRKPACRQFVFLVKRYIEKSLA